MRYNKFGRHTGVRLVCTGVVVMLLAIPVRPAFSQAVASTAGGAPNSAVKFWEAGSSVRWMRATLSEWRARGGNAGRLTAYVSLAQYRAVRAAAAANAGATHPSLAGAAAGASVAVLSAFYPGDAAAFEAALVAQSAEPKWPGEQQMDFAAGVALGRDIGAQVLALAATDGVNSLDPGTPPVGPGYWVSSGAPIVRGNYGARPFFLTDGGEVLSPPPPAFGSAAFLAALAEVRAISDNRTAEQDAIARKWVPFSGPLYNAIAADLIVKYHRSELEAARIFAYANTAAFDAIVGCFYTKFQYWYIRPGQADPGIKPPAGLVVPNHPSYPSAHSCEAGAFQGVLTDAFPSERDLLEATAQESSMSRIYAGFHYRFDAVEGLELGRRVAAIALERKGIE